ncbi:hypothetical protein NESM_000394700 [Novymonas esmeraldas]|uniref:Uncharacterized protein n=1 Tax=Novymonas esmeraldas TaxID=1808958 RepID=A0AAW0EL04_9TRYP
MQRGVNDVLTPWSAPRILQIMEAASVSRTAAGSGSPPEDSAVDLESLLRLSNELPDIAARVMVAPLFSQRPLVELRHAGPAPRAPPASMTYPDAHHMCTVSLAPRQGATTPDSQRNGESTSLMAPESLVPHPSERRSAAAAELEEVAFAAEFAEPCIRGSFPDVAAAVHHVLEGADNSTPSHSASEHGTLDALHAALRRLLELPSVTHAAAPVQSASAPIPTCGRAPGSSLRLNLAQPLPSAAATTASPSRVLGSIPPPSLVPIDFRGPPGHRLFDQGCVAHTFSASEREELLCTICADPPPLRVFSGAELEARRQAEDPGDRPASAPAPAGLAGLAAAAALSLESSRAPNTESRRADGGVGGGDDHGDDDDWSPSSGWSSHSGSGEPGDGAAKDGGAPAQDEAKTGVRVDGGAEEDGHASLAPAALGPVAATAASSSSPSVAPQLAPAGPTRTWVGDDGDLVLENGRVTVRKRKIRVVKNPPPPPPLPTVVSSPLGYTPDRTLILRVAPVGGLHSSAAVTAVQDGAKPSDEAGPSAVQTEAQGPHVKRTWTAGAKRSRGAAARSLASDDIDGTATTSKSAEGAGAAGATGPAKSASSTAGAKGAAPPSTEEVLQLIAALRVPETLRRALLIGVVAPPITDASPEHSPASVKDEEQDGVEEEEHATGDDGVDH